MKNKRKRIILFIFIIVLIVFFINYVNANNDKSSSDLNSIIDVGQDVYVQHNNNNEDIYLLTSQGTQTVVYKILNVKS